VLEGKACRSKFDLDQTGCTSLFCALQLRAYSFEHASEKKSHEYASAILRIYRSYSNRCHRRRTLACAAH
jgi:hypothetical protein